MAEYLIQSETLDDIADAINAKTGGSSAMTPAEMVAAIGNIPSGGGGANSVEYTPINIVTVLNSSTIGNTNGFIVPVTLGNISKIEATVKFDSSLTHCIWFTSVRVSDGLEAVPFVDKSSGTSVSVAVGTTDSDGFTAYTLTNLADSLSNIVKFGSWRDTTYSHNVSFKSIKGYDSNDDVLFELIPCTLRSGMACMLNKTEGKFIFPTFLRTDITVAGEVV